MNILAIRSPGVINNLTATSSLGLPIGLAYIVGAIRDLGDIQVIDPFSIGEKAPEISNYNKDVSIIGLTPDQILYYVKKAPEICLISSMFSMDWPITRTLINLIKTKYPKCLIIGGGEHFSAVTEYSFIDSSIDIIVTGEGEETIRELILCINDGNKLPINISGTVVRNPNNKDELIYNKPRKRIRNLDSIQKPAWDLFNVKPFLDNGVGSTSGNRKNFRPFPIIMTRGCPYECTFCSNPDMWGRKWSTRPPSDVINEMKEYINEYDATHFYSCDLTAIIKESWIIEFCNLLIKENLNITWGMPTGTRSEVLNLNVLKLLKESGCDDIDYAPESGSNFVLKSIKKKISKKAMLKSMKECNKLNMKTKANIILGFPEEKRRHIFETYLFAIRMAFAGIEDLAATPLAAYPGSKIFHDLYSKGEIKYSDDYFFGLSSQGSIDLSASYSKISTLELYIYKMGLFGVFYLVSFFLRPKRLWNLVNDLYHDREGTRLSAGILGILKNRNIRKRKKEFQVSTHF